MPVEIRELVIQAKLDETTNNASKAPAKVTNKSTTDDCNKELSDKEKTDLKEEILEYLLEYFYNQRLR